MQVAVLVINYGTATLTARAVASALRHPDAVRVLVVDNGSASADVIALRAALPDDPRVELLELASNSGFAGGSETGVERVLADPSIEAAMFLNSDATLEPGALARLVAALDPVARVASAGGRMLAPAPSDRVDSLGITLYRSCLASNRLATEEAYLGPTGGCALYHRTLLEALRAAHGHVFDRDFFCYAEDTDVAARALLLGFRPAYVDAIVARHVGQASSGGSYSDFVLYHGIRNSIWMATKCIPATVLLRNAFWIALAHVGIVLRHTVRGRIGVVWRLYRDALRGMPAMRAKRRKIRRTTAISAREFATHVTSRFYERDYVRRALRELFVRGRT